ncbi:globin domain-containing protein [Ruegeria sp. R13_0]|uniref:globin domain-containing protein n=1 Tax=Ruegeria sp. R13_0 TaxID=2821099 RepID=UPI001ADC0155|nr:globin domain-containing protein [Ruegeria sp. R13_0]
MKLCQTDIENVRSSYFLLSGSINRAGEVFYERLFEIAPETRQMFLNDMTVQASKLMSTIGFVVSQLQDESELTPLVQDLALRHLAYGVEEEHYWIVKTALVQMLVLVLEDAATKDVLDSWSLAYDALAGDMIEAAYREKTDCVEV